MYKYVIQQETRLKELIYVTKDSSKNFRSKLLSDARVFDSDKQAKNFIDVHYTEGGGKFYFIKVKVSYNLNKNKWDILYSEDQKSEPYYCNPKNNVNSL